MPATATDRLFGLTTSVAVKAPCRAVATANITLSGLQTINGVTVIEGDRVLVTAQTSSIDNGIYLASSSGWERAPDFDGARDAVQGTQVPIARNGAQTALYEVSSANPITFGTTALTFALRYSANLQYDITAAEIAAGVTVVNTSYPAGEVERYGENTIPRTTDMTAAFNAAFKVAKTSGCDVVFGRTWPYLVTAPINVTVDALQDFYGFNVRCIGQAQATTANSPGYPAILANHTGHVFDCAGAPAINWFNVTVGTTGSNSPKTCWFLARNSAESSQIHRMYSCRVYGSFSEAILYNYGSEEDCYYGCQFHNTHTDGKPWAIFTAFNIRNLSSTFITIATGQQSTIDHYISGGNFVTFSSNPSAKGLYLDSIRLMKIVGPHLGNGAMGVAGHSHIFIDTTNGGSDAMTLVAVTGEQSAPSPNYGIYIGDTVATHAQMTVVGCSFPNSVNTIKGHANVHVDGLYLLNLDNQSAGGGVNVAGTLSGCYDFNTAGGVTAGVYGENNIFGLNPVIANAGEASLTLRDNAGASNEKNWRIRSTGTSLVFSAFNDALGANINPLELGRTGVSTTKVGFHGASPIAKPTVTGAKGGNAALTDLIAKLVSYGIITDGTS